MEEQKLIPTDIVYEILSRIPCRPLLEKFRYICKLWYAIIKDPRFIYLHLERSRKSSTQLAVITRSLKESSAYWKLNISSLNNQVHQGWTRKKLLSKTGLNHSYPLSVLSVNGLICIQGSNKDIHVCNPSNGEFTTLPKSNLGFADETLGFGFDSMTREYKVVRVSFPLWYDFEKDVGSEICEIFTLGSKTWRRIDGHTGPLSRYTASVDGIIYWVVNKGFKEIEIVSLDLRKEELGKVPSPKTKSKKKGPGIPVLLESGGRLYLAETSGHYLFDESGALIRNICCREEVEIWMLEDCSNNNHHVWVKLYNIVLEADVLSRYPRQWMPVIPLRIWDRMILLEGFDGGVVGCYDLESGSLTKILDQYYACRPVSYIESLVPLKP